MSDDRPDEGAEAEQGGVFGKLPASRPGTRSPRRDSAAKAKGNPAATKAKAKAAPTATKRKRPAAPKPRPEAEPRLRASERIEEPQGEQAGGLDDLAWAGIAAVAEAATLGVRIANRALGALRDSVDRR
jgi:hypothetical protein